MIKNGVKVDELIEAGFMNENNGLLWTNDEMVNEANKKGGLLAEALGSIEKKATLFQIFRAKGLEYQQFINVDVGGHDRRMSDDQAETLRSIMNSSSEVDIRSAVDQIMEALQLHERQQAVNQSLASVKEVKRESVGKIMQDMENDYLTRMVREYTDENGLAKIYQGVNGAGYNLYKTQMQSPTRRLSL